MKEVKVGEKKVLLCRLDGQYYAVNQLCTHYKAQLVKGTLSSDGRIVCPWHGACWNAKTGDIEDAPGLDHLTSFKVKIDGEKVIVIANEEELNSGKRIKQPVKRNHEDPRTFIVIGSGAAGANAVEVIREEGFKGRLIMITKEGHLPIDRVKLSKSLKAEIEKLLLKPESFYQENDIEVMLNTEVIEVNHVEQTVTLKDGQRIKYDSLLLATGSIPRNFWPANKSMKNVFFVRRVSDLNAIEKAVEAHANNAKIAVVGSSFIGMETAAMLAKQAASVTVLGSETVPFERVLGKDLGKFYQDWHESKGIKFIMSSVVNEFLANDQGNCRALKLTYGGQTTELETDIVILGVGAAPDTEFLKKSSTSFNIQNDGSLLVDEKLAVVGIKNVYAAGDIARFPYPYFSKGTPIIARIEHWGVASQQGRIAAKNMLGKELSYHHVPYFWTAQYGKSLRYCGFAHHYTDIVIQGSLEEQTFIGYYIDGEEIVAICSMGKDPIVSHASELFRLGLMPPVSFIREGKDLLSISLKK